MNSPIKITAILILLTGSALSITSCQPKTSLPVVTTSDITSITSSTAVSGGAITDDGGAAITAKGVCWSKSLNPTTADNKTADGSGTESFTSSITGLDAGTTYYVRAFAANSAGIAYGNQKSFTTAAGIGTIIFNPDLVYGTVSDIDGNVYKTIQIGSQIWMAENLKTTKLNDNTPIPHVTDFTAWNSLSSPGYCWYNNDPLNKAVYGALYNWFTVETGKLCPAGWHVPSNEEWISLQTFLGGMDVAAGKLKETGTSHWQIPNDDATNESGFTGLPGAQRDITNDFGSGAWIGIFGQWWTSTYEFNEHAYMWELYYGKTTFYASSLYNLMGISVRCIQN